MYLLVLLVLPIWGVATGLFRPWLVVVNLAACLPLVWLALRFLAVASPSTAWWLFRLSGPYLAVVFLALVLARGT